MAPVKVLYPLRLSFHVGKNHKANSGLELNSGNLGQGAMEG
jgi:hypothetical protein